MTNLERAPMAHGVSPSNRHARILAGYLLNRKRGPLALRKMIQDDITRFIDLGARGYASELAEVLKRFESSFPQMPDEAA